MTTENESPMGEALKAVSGKTEKPKRIKICDNHRQERPTPLIWTFAFPYREYWCPYCGWGGGMMGAGTNVDETPELLATAKADKERSAKFLKAVSQKNCSEMKYKGKWIKPSDLPEKVKAKNSAIIEAWVYGHNTALTGALEMEER